MKRNAKDLLTEIANDIDEHVQYLKDEGVESLPRHTMEASQKAPENPVESSAPTKSTTPEPASLDAVIARIASCEKCPLSTTRTNTVPGVGSPTADLLFIGEGPGTEEDKQGIPFVGRAGQLLTRLIERMGLSRDEVYIANIVKCRPTANLEMKKDRPPTSDEMEACLPYLKEQIATIKPKVIVTLGNVAMEGLFGVKGITKLRGQWKEFEGIPTLPTYHPSFLLRNGGEDKKHYWEVWHDMEAVLEKLGRTAPVKK